MEDLKKLYDIIGMSPRDTSIACTGRVIKHAILKCVEIPQLEYNKFKLITKKHVLDFKNMYIDCEHPLSDNTEYVMFYGGRPQLLLCRKVDRNAR